MSGQLLVGCLMRFPFAALSEYLYLSASRQVAIHLFLSLLEQHPARLLVLWVPPHILLTESNLKGKKNPTMRFPLIQKEVHIQDMER